MKTNILILAILFLGTLQLQAQEKESCTNHEAPLETFSLEFNGGPSIATNNLSGSRLNPGFGFEASILWNFMPHTGVYAGWGWNRLDSESSFVGNDACFEETGYVLGLQFKHPIKSTNILWFLRAGMLYNHIEVENAEGVIVADTGHGSGFQVVGGVDFLLGKGWSISPGIKFNSLTRSLEYEQDSQQLRYKYVSLRVGLVKSF
ncbi:MAG: outer membrane beta-barrel protein [Bacteroidales bacterium]|nr:outer membrane beta-barrel protein [Bacteroidales bacterium]